MRYAKDPQQERWDNGVKVSAPNRILHARAPTAELPGSTYSGRGMRVWRSLEAPSRTTRPHIANHTADSTSLSSKDDVDIIAV